MLQRNPVHFFRWLFDSRFGLQGHLLPRWIFLRALAAIYFSAFYSLLFQIRGLTGPQGILPARDYLAAIAQSYSGARYLYAPSVFWLSASSAALMTVTWIGLIAAITAFFNAWPRISFLVCFVCFLSFVSTASVFSNYQSDGMLLEAGFIALFFAPSGIWPGLGAHSPPSRASLFLLLWEWFRIYFESGVVKLLSGDVEWRNLTAMDEYYQNGPLPTWIGWYIEHLPHWFHAASAGGTLAMELVVVLLLFFPRRVRMICFFIVTPWEVGVILTANYTFLNYLVLSLGFLLLDDRALWRIVPQRFRPVDEEKALRPARRGMRGALSATGLGVAAVMLTWVGYDTTAELLAMAQIPLPTLPVEVLEPFRIANQYGLFAVMTRGRYEIEFQGSMDGETWTAYPFRYKPQALNEAPGIYAPYQPRFEWNLWFASLGDWQQNDMVPLTEEKLLVNDKDVLALFKANPFEKEPPHQVRAVLWQYWFTSMEEKRRTGNWWRRQFLGVYAPVLASTSGGKPTVVAYPDELPPHD